MHLIWYSMFIKILIKIIAAPPSGTLHDLASDEYEGGSDRGGSDESEGEGEADGAAGTHPKRATVGVRTAAAANEVFKRAPTKGDMAVPVTLAAVPVTTRRSSVRAKRE